MAPELVGKDFSTRDYYKGLVAAGDTYVSEAFVSAQAGRPFVVTITTYVRAPSPDGRTPGKPLAILLLGVELDAVQPLADSVAAAQGVNLWVADQRGKLLAAPGGRPPGLEPVAAEPIGQAASHRAGQPGDLDLRGAAMTVVHRRVDQLGWTVFAAIPHAEAYRGVEAIRTTMLAIAIPLGVIVCCGIVVLVRLQRRQWRVEAALEVARDRAHDASRLKTEFLSRISHELRTPLNAILGFGQLLQLDDLTEEQRESVDQMLRGGRHLLGLINEVLDISRIETGTVHAEQTDVQGTGLGLALSEGLIEAMGGTLAAHSVQGEGTTFTLGLALAEDQLADHDGNPPATPGPGQDTGADSEHVVLYVEDNRS